MTAALGPIEKSDRLTGLDLLRGIAMLGIIPANMPTFNIPDRAAHNTYYFSEHWSEAASYAFLHGVVDNKFLTLFAIMFGAGMVIQWRSAVNKGIEFHPFYLKRLAILAVIGLIHGLLFWFGDILFWYSACGVFASFFIKQNARRLLALSIGSLLLSAALFFSVGYLYKDEAPPLEKWTHAKVSEQARVVGKVPYTIDEQRPGVEHRVYTEGSYREQLRARGIIWLGMLAIMFFYGWRILGLFFLGMAFMKWRLFDPRGERRRILKWMLGLGILVGISLEWPRAYLMTFAELNEGEQFMVEGVHHIGATALSIGYLALVLLLPQRWSDTGVLRFFVNVGRVALSAYLFETVACVFVFYSIGLGFYGELTRLQIWMASGALALIILCLATLWTRSYRFGPVEWFWRSLAYDQWQPMRKSESPES